MLADVKRGLVTVEGAKRYGVVIEAARVDAAATRRLRETLAVKQAQQALFNRGFTRLAS